MTAAVHAYVKKRLTNTAHLANLLVQPYNHKEIETLEAEAVFPPVWRPRTASWETHVQFAAHGGT